MKPWLDRWFTFRKAPARALWRALCMVVFFHAVCFGWLLFRADSVEVVLDMCRSIGTNFVLDFGALGDNGLVIVVSCALMLFFVQCVQYLSGDLMVVFRLPVLVRSAVYAIVILLFVLFGEYGGISFIYFQF